MAPINRTPPKKRKKNTHGAFLTLGITFLSIIVLGLATLLLRHAETSADRLKEIAVFDRIYNLDRSIGHTLYKGITTIANFTLTINETSLIIRHPIYGDEQGVPAPVDRPYGIDYNFVFKSLLKLYVESANPYITLPANSNWTAYPDKGTIDLTFEGINTTYFYGFLVSGVGSGNLFGGSFAHLLAFNRGIYKEFYVKFTTTNSTEMGTIGWTTGGQYTLPGADPANNAVFTVIFQGPTIAKKESQIISVGTADPCPLGGTASTQVAYIYNLSVIPGSQPPVAGLGTVSTTRFCGDFIGAAPMKHNLTIEVGLILRNPATTGITNHIYTNISIPELGIEKFGPVRMA